MRTTEQKFGVSIIVGEDAPTHVSHFTSVGVCVSQGQVVFLTRLVFEEELKLQ